MSRANNQLVLQINDVVFEAMPFSSELVEWIRARPDFKEGLKFSNPDGFLALGAISCSHTPDVPGDEVIGFFAYDTKEKLFKQDFIVNVGGTDTQFVLYSKQPSKRYGKYVKHFNEFKAKYAINGRYQNVHHLSLADLDAMNNPGLSERARDTIALANRIEAAGGRKQPSSVELADTLEKIREALGRTDYTADTYKPLSP
jgi:hypothetical protein